VDNFINGVYTKLRACAELLEVRWINKGKLDEWERRVSLHDIRLQRRYENER
jgi:hypothetical protein